MPEMMLRLALSLALVFALLSVVSRIAARRFQGGTQSPLRVLHRQGLSKGSSMAVVAVGERVLLVGATEHQVQLITELDGDELAAFELGQLMSKEEADPTERKGALASFDRFLVAATTRKPPDDDAPERPPAPRRRPPGTAGPPDGVLAGSLLSGRTWRQAAQAVTGRDS
ncbi:MAG TPA: flagellar biosynthetic protein FliO [Nocardioides sp.]|nr:flagellar biosynthetic protein FliO [Nocardioides sp.]